MSYLHHATKNISSSYGRTNRKKGVNPLLVLIILAVLIICYFVFGGILGNMLFGIKNMFVPDAKGVITLRPGAYDARMSALEVENNALKQLLQKTGIALPSNIEVESDSAMLAKERVARSVEENTQTTASSSPMDTGGPVEPTTATQTPPEGVAETNNVATTEPLNENRLSLKSGDILASVLVRPPQSPYDALIVNVGEESGVQVGDQVYAFAGFPIGEIVETKKTRSTVRLLSAPGSKVDVLIGTSTMAVTAEGKGAGNFFLKLPKVTEIKVGDVVTRTYFPPEVLSTIESVDSEDGEAYIYAYFKLPIQLNSLVYVLIKKNTSQL